MSNLLLELKKILEKIHIKQQKPNDNIFEIGTRGFYENPFTEVLSFLLNSQSKYPNRDSFVINFLKSLPNLSNEVFDSFLNDLKVSTQYTTINKKFIDLIIFNDKYILVFENKIFHWLANPFEEYETDIKTRYSTLSPFFYILSYNSTNIPPNWINVTINDCFEKIKNNLIFKFDNKWDFYIYDFLEHYIQTNKEKMTHQEFEFYTQNFSKIIAGNNYVNNFIYETTNKVKAKLAIDSIKRTSGISDWGGNISRAVRFYPFETMDNVVFVFRNDGKFSISVYYYKEYGNFISEISNIVGNHKYRNWQEGTAMCFTLQNGNTCILQTTRCPANRNINIP